MTPERLRALLDYDHKTGKFLWRERPLSEFKSDAYGAYWNGRYVGKEALRAARPDGYIQRLIGGERVYAHRAAWAIHYGEWPDGDIDHINGDKSDNRIGNLRVVSRADNQRNRPMPRTNTSGIVGVRWEEHRNRWRADIRVNGTRVNIGRYHCKSAAVIARKAAEVRHGYHPNHGRPV